MTELTVVISYYKALDNLKLILKALSSQSSMDFEVILSEDDNNQETIEYIESLKPHINFPIRHLYQKVDIGFRKNQMLNRAINSSVAEKIAFIDGDCVPHRHFVKQYILNIDSHSFCIGRAVMLDEKITESIKKAQLLHKLSFFSILFSNSNKVKESIFFPYFTLSLKLKGLVGRNWGVSKKALIEVNGFDEDYIHAGIGEDVDIEWRLLKHGLRKKSVKNKAIVYHLYHKRWYSSKTERLNYSVMQQKIQQGKIQCINGIKTIGNKK